jgi:hypothetical protein
MSAERAMESTQYSPAGPCTFGPYPAPEISFSTPGPAETYRLLAVDGMSGERELEEKLAQFFVTAFITFKERQKKYGSNNIARRGTAGVVVRLDDKLARLEQLGKGKGGDVQDETTMDTCIDIANYAAIAWMCQTGAWPEYKA